MTGQPCRFAAVFCAAAVAAFTAAARADHGQAQVYSDGQNLVISIPEGARAMVATHSVADGSRIGAPSPLVTVEMMGTAFAAMLSAVVEGPAGLRAKLESVEDAVVTLATHRDNATRCGEYPEVANGVAQGGGDTAGSVRLIECSAGHMLSGSSGMAVCH